MGKNNMIPIREGDMWFYIPLQVHVWWCNKQLLVMPRKSGNTDHILAVMPDIDSMAHLKNGKPDPDFDKSRIKDFIPMSNYVWANTFTV